MDMRIRRRSFRFALAFAAGACATGVAAQDRWATYSNARFGTTASVPIDLFTVRDPPTDNGDGQIFHTGDGRARLAIWGARNAEGDSPQSYVAKNVNQEGVSFRRTTARFYVVSGTREGDIFYERCNFRPNRYGVIDCLNMTYPGQDKAIWDPIVSRLSGSLREGRGVEAR